MTLSGGKGLGPIGALRLAGLLREVPAPLLVGLDLSGNGIGPDGTTALAAHLERLTKLQSLNLSNNGLDPPSAMAVATALTTITSLTSLDVRKNWLDLASAMALAAVTSLTSLDIRGMDLEDGPWPVMSFLLPRASQLKVDMFGDVKLVSGVGAKGTSRMTLSGGKGLGPIGALRLAGLLREVPAPLLVGLDLRRRHHDPPTQPDTLHASRSGRKRHGPLILISS